MKWNGTERNGMERNGTERNGMEWSGTECDLRVELHAHRERADARAPRERLPRRRRRARVGARRRRRRVVCVGRREAAGHITLHYVGRRVGRRGAAGRRRRAEEGRRDMCHREEGARARWRFLPTSDGRCRSGGMLRSTRVFPRMRVRRGRVSARCGSCAAARHTRGRMCLSKGFELVRPADEPSHSV